MDQQELFKFTAPKARRRKKPPFEWKIVPFRECARPYGTVVCECPEIAVQYWCLNVETAPHFNASCECFVVLILNTRKHIMGHQLVTIGLLDSLLVHAREAFRAAIIAAAHSVIFMHNHPSGDPAPSDADIRATRDLVRAGQLLRIEVTDHIIVGNGRHLSLREFGIIQP